MKRIISRAFIFLLLSCFVAGQVQAKDTYIKREVRSAWLATVYSLDWPSKTGTSLSVQATQKTQLTNYLDSLQAKNFNAIYFQVRSMCDAFYKSSYEPWSSYLTGSRGADPGWDPLAFAVEECHKRGLECHAWVNPYRWATTASGWSTAQDQELKQNGMLLTYTSGSSTTIILNPALASVRERIVNVCKEIITNYAVDGIIFDDYFYPSGIQSTSEAEDYQLWKNSGTSLSIGDWRRDNVNKMVAGVYNMVQATKPYVKFGISPAGVACSSKSVADKHGIDKCPTGSDWQYNGIFSDPVAWLQAGTIDYISPQIYWRTTHSTNPFGPITQWWSYVAKHFNRHHYASHSISALGSSNTKADWEDYGKQIQYSRDYTENAAPGVVLYSTAYINGAKAKGLGQWLLYNKFQKKSLTPAIDWKKAPAHDKVHNMKVQGQSLTWNAEENVRYSVYAIPNTLTNNAAETSSSGGILADYLLGVSYKNEYSFDKRYAEGYRFAVCILDYYGNEFAPRYSTDIEIPATSAPLLSPNNGEMVTEDFTLSWEMVDVDSYVLEVASDPNFKNIVLTASEGFTESGKNLEYTILKEDLLQANYYWRVITKKLNAPDGYSETFSFFLRNGIQERGYEQKYDQAGYSEIDGVKIENLWMRNTKPEFENIEFTSQGNCNRSFCVHNDTLYMTERNINAFDTECYLRRYDCNTGAQFSSIHLPSEIQGKTLPNNNIVCDEAGNLLISNYTVKAKGQPLKLWQIHVQDSTAILRAEVETSKIATARIDYCAVGGNVETGNFQIYSVITNSKKIVKWEFTNGELSNETTITLEALYPASATNVGLSPRITLLGNNQCIINGASIHPTRYDLLTGKIIGTFEENFDAEPMTSAIETNDFRFFTLGKDHYAVYPINDYSTSHGYTYLLAKAQEDCDLTSLEPMWNIPYQGMGTVNNKLGVALADYDVNQQGDTARIYLFVPGNGLAAYRLTGQNTSGIKLPTLDKKITLTFDGQTLRCNEKADCVNFYNTHGQLIYQECRTKAISVQNLKRGTYIVRASLGRSLATTKIKVR